MCGILAVNLRNGETCDFGSSISSIQHRGPDDQGMFVSNDCKTHLAQVRLSIIDLSEAGHQPMVDASGRYVIIYNGEIYNYEELKEELAKKYSIVSWRSVTDTEVIVEGFAREGLSFLSKLNGIFSLVIYDCYKNFLHVLRDPFGIKPLFYTRQNDGVYFCSELKGLLAIETLNRTIRQQSLSDQLAFMYVPEPYTLYNE
ncbi:Asparagine synthetase [glutamine-hydrolyzing], partial [hydrothermal vent metagenome]